MDGKIVPLNKIIFNGSFYPYLVSRKKPAPTPAHAVYRKNRVQTKEEFRDAGRIKNRFF